MRNQYTDKEGRLHAVYLPAGAPEEDAHMGMSLGPPSLKDLGLPLEMEVRLHNELFHRGVLSYDDAKARSGDLVAALMATFRVDASKLQQIYYDSIVEPPLNGRRKVKRG